MHITIFGILFFVITLFSFRSYSLCAYVYVLSYLFQSSSILDVGSISICPYIVSPLILWVRSLYLASDENEMAVRIKRTSIVFFVFVVFQSVACTYLFPDLKVFHEGGMETNLATSGENLTFTVKNIYQWIYLGINLIGINTFSSHIGQLNDNFCKNVITWSVLIVIFLGIWRYVTVNFGGWFPDGILYSNQNLFSEDNNLEQVISGRIRFTSIMIEASVCGLFLAYSIWNIYYLNIEKKIFLYLLICLCILLTISSTGLSLAILGFIMNALLGKRNFKAISFSVIFLACMSIVIMSYDVFSDIYNALFVKMDSTSADARFSIMSYNWDVFLDTFMLGCGLGSTIGSNFLLFLLSSIGLLGVVLFSFFLYNIYLFAKERGGSLFVIPSLLLIIGMTYSGGTLSHPFLWMQLVVLLSSTSNILAVNIRNTNDKSSFGI